MKWRWRLSVLLFLSGMFLLGTPLWASQPGEREVSFSWGQVVVLGACAVAWGDLRREVQDIKADVHDLKKRR